MNDSAFDDELNEERAREVEDDYDKDEEDTRLG